MSVYYPKAAKVVPYSRVEARRSTRTGFGQPGSASPTARAYNPAHARRRYLPLRDAIESFWLDPEHQRTRTWTEHLDINEVMLATCLAPEGFLILRTPHQTSD